MAVLAMASCNRRGSSITSSSARTILKCWKFTRPTCTKP